MHRWVREGPFNPTTPLLVEFNEPDKPFSTFAVDPTDEVTALAPPSMLDAAPVVDLAVEVTPPKSHRRQRFPSECATPAALALLRHCIGVVISPRLLLVSGSMER
jgi:hypothetical protein